MKTNKGITLIALIITIIVLLILAGISIATLTGENGVLTKASTAKVQTEIENAKEQAKLDIMAWTTEKMETGDNTKLNDTIVKNILKDKDYVKGEPGEKSFISKQGEHEILYSDLYSIEKTSISFSILGSEPFIVTEGTTWHEWIKDNYDILKNMTFDGKCPVGEESATDLIGEIFNNVVNDEDMGENSELAIWARPICYTPHRLLRQGSGDTIYANEQIVAGSYYLSDVN